MKARPQLLVAVAAAFAIAACGGGSSPPSTPSPAPTQPHRRRRHVVGDRTARRDGRASAARVDRRSRRRGISPRSRPERTARSRSRRRRIHRRIPIGSNISGSGLVSRSVWVSWQSGARSGIAIDVIRESAPFSMTFYRNFVRGVFDHGRCALSGHAVDGVPSLLCEDRRSERPRGRARGAAGRARFDRPGGDRVHRGHDFRWRRSRAGPKTAPAALGWININIRRDPNERTQLRVREHRLESGLDHVEQRRVLVREQQDSGRARRCTKSDTHSGSSTCPIRTPSCFRSCPAIALRVSCRRRSNTTPAIAYSRPRGNLDPDIDPSSSQTITVPHLTTDR